jgi:hypothetical protein
MCEEVSFCKIMLCSSLLEEIRSEFVFIVTTLGLRHSVATVATAEENAEGLFVVSYLHTNRHISRNQISVSYMLGVTTQER